MIRKISIAGIIILISVSPLFRGLYFAYETYGFLALIVLLCIPYFISKIKDGESIHINKLYVFIGLALITATALSFINAANPRENLGTLLQYSELLVLLIVLYDYFYGRKLQYIRFLMIPVALAGSVCAVVGLMALTGRFNVWEVTTFYGRIGSTFQYANTAAIYFVICLIFSITLINAETNIFIRAVAAGLGCIFIFAFLMTGSRGGYLVLFLIMPALLLLYPTTRWINSVLGLFSMTIPLVITLEMFNLATSQHDNVKAAMCLMISFFIASVIYIVLSLFYRGITKNKDIKMPKGAKVVLGIILAAVLVLVTVYRNSILQLLPDVMANRLTKLLTEGINELNIQIRLHYNIDALKLIAENWLIGLGGGGWKAMYQSVQDYYYTAVFVHNHYLQVFVENGILGFASFVSIVGVSIVGCIYTYIKNKDTVTRSYAAGLFCALVSLAGHAIGDFDLSFVSLMLLLWAMCAAGMPSGKVDITVNGASCKVGIVAICSILFSFYGMYFLGAYNENNGFKCNQKRDYVMAAAYYEEAYRFDPANSFYSFELAKLYHYFGKVSKSSEARDQWMEKALQASLRSVEECKNYPTYLITLIKIYHDSGMPLDALEVSQKLVECQKYNAEVYELLARSYVKAAEYYESKGETDEARELLKKCIDIDQNPYLRRSGITIPQDIDSEMKISKYKHSKELAGYLEEAADMLASIS